MTTKQMDWVDDQRSGRTEPDEDGGVWIVWDSTVKGHMYVVFPKDQELQARRWSDEAGYGHVEFRRFGVES